MLTPRLRRRRRTVDTYVHVELEESTPSGGAHGRECALRSAG